VAGKAVVLVEGSTASLEIDPLSCFTALVEVALTIPLACAPGRYVVGGLGLPGA